MKKTLILLAIILLLGAGYFTYEKWVKNSDTSLWSFVPQNTLLVYESNRVLPSLLKIQNTSIWKNLSYISEVGKINEYIDVLDTLAGKGNFRTFFSKNPTLITVNVTSSKSFDFLYVAEIQNLSQQTFITKAQNYFIHKGFKKRTRAYEDFTITELVGNEPDHTFTYIYYKNYFIGSFSAFLVEDAIRTVSNKDRKNFEEGNLELKLLTKLEKDEGNLYINASKLSSLLNIFTTDVNSIQFAKSSFVDLKVSDDIINLTGFTFSDKSSQFLKNFSHGSGGTFDMAEIVPNNTSWFYHLSARDPNILGSSLINYFNSTDKKVLEYRKKILSETDFDVNTTFDLIDQEIGLAQLESTVTGEKTSLLILEINDMGEALNYFNSVGERHMQQTGDSLYSEQYGTYDIRKLPLDNFPYALIGSLAEGFQDSYYLQFRNYLIFSNSLQQLKNFTISIEEESTWTKSIRINRFLENTNKEANFSLFVNVPRAWNQLLKSLKPDWENNFSESQFSLKNMEFMAFQFSTVDDKFYTNITLYQPELPNHNIPDKVTTIETLTLADIITTKPHLVTNHNDRSREIFVQDSASSIYLIDANFKVLWNKQLNDQITSDVAQIDYYNNGKLQYIFSTKTDIHIIDRTGKYIPEYPKSLKGDQEITHFGIIDYDNTKKYRFALTDTEGNAYLTDKNLKPLAGWNPMKFDSPLVQAPTHRRVNGKDVIIALQTNGKLSLLTRKGGNYPGFPKEIEATIASEMFIQNANSLEKSTITLLSKQGEIIEFNFKGQLIRREQLYKPGANSLFSILEDVTGDAYLLLRQTDNTYELLDGNGNVLFEKDYFAGSPLFHQYYNLGGDTEFIVFVDPGGSYLYLYDKTGNLMTGRPLSATQPISMLHFDNQFQIYKTVDRNLELISLSF